MELSRVQERESSLFEGARGAFRAELDGRAQRFQDVRASRPARDRPVPVLGDGDAGGGRHERHGGRDVVGVRAVPSRAARIEEGLPGRWKGDRLRPERFRTPQELRGRLPAPRQREEERLDLLVGCLAAHHGAHRGARLLPGQTLAAREPRQKLPDHRVFVLDASGTRRRKLRRRSFPHGVRIDSGWNWTPQVS